MGIEAKHAYRFGYLKSEAWQTVRIEALAREKGRCQICQEFSVSNDAHHVEYPDSIFETKEHHLVILCRACHDLIHSILEIHNLKTHTKTQFYAIATALMKWKGERQSWLNEPTIGKKAKAHIKCASVGMDYCSICERPASLTEEYAFFTAIGGSKKYTHKMCADCRDSAKTECLKLNYIPEKPYRIYDAWKKARKLLSQKSKI